MSPQAWPTASTNSLFNLITSSIRPASNTSQRSPSNTRDSNMASKTPAKLPTATRHNKQDNKAKQGPQPKAGSTPSSSQMSDRTSMASAMSEITTLAATDIVDNTRSSLGQLGVRHTSCSMFLAR
ncbi:uncharacterized protein B0H18DRAFT_80298 [Fomitopsis serialis]|uniref:uncharacterized protein n=1 Tax=Fomitopsis serialis TaxID=139415 RepID=UPI002007F7F0|nr:uncharacterized protein B0H18DRAFT_80298 [Neoantrodia serialis]KAH9915911.1 hypothetical protein B0H18DRAFT_80298 [Neoantrodia serialis]